MEQIVKYDITNAAIAKMNDLYIGLVITDLGSKEEFNAVHDARMVVKGHRLSVETKRKELKADSLAWGKKVDAEAKRISSLLKPIESHLSAEEKKVTEEKERIRIKEELAEKIKINDRVTALFDVGVNIPYFEAAMLSDKEYETKLDVATNEYNAERLRLQEEQKANEEAEAKLEADRAEIARIKKEQADKAKEQADKEAALKEQAKLIEDEKKAEAERKEREAFEKKAKEEARIQAEKEAKEKAEKERREQRKKTEESRTKLLSAVDFSVARHDLGTMPNDQFDRMYREAKAKWDKKQAKLLTEKLEKERIKTEKKRIAEEKADREAKVQKTKEARFESLKKIGFEYPFNDLGIMPDRQYIELYSLHKKDWDAKQQALLVEKLEKERVEKEKAETAEKARVEVLKPDKEKLIQYAKNLTQIIGPDVKDKAAQRIVALVEKQLSAIAQEIINQAKDL